MSQDEGLNDAAILLMSMGEDEASEVFKHLSPKEVQKLGEAIAKTRVVPKEKVEMVVEKFIGVAASQSLLVSDSGDYVRNVLKRALGDDKAALLIDRILQGGDVSGIESLKWMDPLSVAELLRNEHPQIVAAILVHVDYDQAAALFRTCRRNGETVRKLIDCLIASVAIRSNAPVLHADADFAVLARHTALTTHERSAA